MINVGFRLRMTIVGLLLFSVSPAWANNPGGRYTIGTGTILDTKTNLTWQQPAPTGTYVWADAKTYCSNLGAGWRLPTVKELQTLVDYSTSTSPTIDSVFSGTAQAAFWASTRMSGAFTDVWTVHFGAGSTISTPPTDFPSYVRCVR